ncbi:NUDIX hydrolase [Glycomyces sp. A-F 0318]|uniref:NUDIX hydrolase n=1 Tax=Glycomyces amatae TaxID=2881355 RepID=UPI001E304FAF|nr:NUDIX hydrolase [Glycomyces amatae]
MPTPQHPIPSDREPRPDIAAAVIVDAGTVLLVQRRVPEGPLVWQFPAGKTEPGEIPAEAAVREAREETGLVVEAVAELGQRLHPVTGRQMHYVACRSVAGAAAAAAPREIAAAAWCDREALAARIPDGVFAPVAAYLDRTLRRQS